MRRHRASGRSRLRYWIASARCDVETSSAGEVGDRPRDAEDARVGARREPEPVARRLEQPPAARSMRQRRRTSRPGRCALTATPRPAKRACWLARAARRARGRRPTAPRPVGPSARAAAARAAPRRAGRCGRAAAPRRARDSARAIGGVQRQLVARVAEPAARAGVHRGDELERRPGRRRAPAPRATVMRRSSSGWRSGSRTLRRNSGSSSRKSTPRWASVTSPGRIGVPPPRSAASEIVQCGARTGRAVDERRGRRAGPATLWIAVTSIASSSVSGGRIDGRRRASMVFPEPGGPSSSTLWPPAAATSSARLACAWPRTSARSPAATARVGEQRVGVDAGRRERRLAAEVARRPRRASRRRRRAARRRAPPRRRWPPGRGARRGRAARAAAAIGSAPRTRVHAAVEPELAEHAPAATDRGAAASPSAARMPSAIGRSNARALLADAGRREVHGDAALRVVEAGVAERGADAVARLAHGAVGQADRGRLRQARSRRRPRRRRASASMPRSAPERTRASMPGVPGRTRDGNRWERNIRRGRTADALDAPRGRA